jgi:gamma-glutamyltranspeptidase/glutathione hydrolase
LRQGGTAGDAAVATALAMAVVHPQAGNLGGGGFAVLRFGDTLTTLDFREVAPGSARRDMYLDKEGQPIPQASWIGPLASGVPGSPAGLFALHQRFGKLPWAEVVAPAIRLAGEGFTITRRLHEAILSSRALLEQFNESAAVWLPAGKVPPVGSRLQLPDLAATLRAYAAKGPAAITSGRIAAAIESSAVKHGGILIAKDLGDYVPEWRQPVMFEAFGWRFGSMGLPSSGGFLVGGALQTLERLDWLQAARFGALRAHLLVESWRRLFADRSLLGDPDSTRIAIEPLLAHDRLARLASGIDRGTATSSTTVRGWPDDVTNESNETVHLSVVDQEGNLVALTTTLNGLFGCGLWVPGAGFFLNNEMDDFSTSPGTPNFFGLVQGPANEVAPGRRMLSSMSPTIAWKGDEALAIGGSGGPRIPTAAVQVLLHLIVDGDSLQTAIDRPRLHHQWFPDRITAEFDALAPETREQLRRLGHEIEISTRGAKINGVRHLADERVEAAGDPRGPAVGGVVVPEP